MKVTKKELTKLVESIVDEAINNTWTVLTARDGGYRLNRKPFTSKMVNDLRRWTTVKVNPEDVFVYAKPGLVVKEFSTGPGSDFYYAFIYEGKDISESSENFHTNLKKAIATKKLQEDSYHVDQIQAFIRQNKNSEYPMQIKLFGENGDTKFLDIKLDVVEKLAELMK